MYIYKFEKKEKYIGIEKKVREREPSHTTMTTPVVKTTLNENGVYEIVLNRPEKKIHYLQN